MPWGWFRKAKSQVKPTASGAPFEGSLEAELLLAADRFDRSLAAVARATDSRLAAFDRYFEERRRGQPAGGKLDDATASDAAAWLGQTLRPIHGGRWAEHGHLGLGLADLGDVAGVWAFPLAMVRKKWELAAGLSLAGFVDRLPARLDHERRFAAELAAPRADDRRLIEAVAARPSTDAFAGWWRARHGQPLPRNLVGLREVDRFLRTHFLVHALRHETLVDLGVLMGELARGLFKGEWSFDEARATGDATRMAVRWPELDLYPVGRVYKLLVEQPESQTLDEYVRSVPAARRALGPNAGTESAPSEPPKTP